MSVTAAALGLRREQPARGPTQSVGIDGNCESTREADALATALRSWCNEAEARRRRDNTWSASIAGRFAPGSVTRGCRLTANVDASALPSFA